MTTLAAHPETETAAPPPTGVSYDQLTVVPARHPGRWIATAVVAVLLAMVLNSLITNPRWEWDVVGAYLTEESIVRGVWMTIQLTFITAALGFALGTVLALMRLSRSPLPLAIRAAAAVILRVTKRSCRSGDSWLNRKPEQANRS